MSTRRDVGLILAAELDNIAPTLDQMARPFARASEMTRRVETALDLVSQMRCECRDGWPEYRECDKHKLERALAGDE